VLPTAAALEARGLLRSEVPLNISFSCDPALEGGLVRPEDALCTESTRLVRPASLACCRQRLSPSRLALFAAFVRGGTLPRLLPQSTQSGLSRPVPQHSASSLSLRLPPTPLRYQAGCRTCSSHCDVAPLLHSLVRDVPPRRARRLRVGMVLRKPRRDRARAQARHAGSAASRHPRRR